MFQFKNWPHVLSEDLRIIRRRKGGKDILCAAYSLSMNACTQVTLDEIASLKAEGVPEITDTPPGCIPTQPGGAR